MPPVAPSKSAGTHERVEMNTHHPWKRIFIGYNVNFV